MEEPKPDKRILLTVAKVLNYLAAAIMIGDVVCRFYNFSKSTDPFFFLLTFYMIGFALLLVIAEAGIKKVLVYVEILSGRKGKGVYIIFVSLLIFDTNYKNDTVCGILIFFIGVFNILVGFMRIKKRDELSYVPNDDEEEVPANAGKEITKNQRYEREE